MSENARMSNLLAPVGRETLRRIVEAATLAPSAENLQPWRFCLDDESLLVYLDLSRQLPSDVGHMLGLTGIGAAIENAVVAASLEDFRANLECFSPQDRHDSSEQFQLIAKLHFSDGGQPDPLSEFVAARCTTRRMESRRMESRRMESRLLSELSDGIERFSNVQLHWVEERRLPEFAALVGMGNRIRFEHRPFHAELYQSLRFTADEVHTTRDGLDVATLQLPFGVARIMRFLRAWPRMRIANVLGFSRGVARQATTEVIRSGAVGFLTVPTDDVRRFVEGGRALERLWLTATKNELRFHPTASLPVFLAHARTGGTQLSSRHRAMAQEMSERFFRLFQSVEGRVVQMAFRVGYGELPPVRSLRRASSSVVDFPGKKT
jgi:hypothetical protein